MADIGSAYVALFPSLDGFEAKIQQALSGIDVSCVGNRIGSELGNGIARGAETSSKATKGLSAKLSALGGVAGGVAATLAGSLFSAVASLGSEMVEAADSSQKFASTLDFAGIDSSTIDQLTASTQAYADQTIYDLADIRNVTAQLASNGVDNYAQLAEAAGNLNAVAGGSADTFRSVSMVMSQTAGQGKLVTENWNQLVDAIPGASGALEEAMRSAGAFEGNFRDAMANGEVSADEFFAAVQKLGMTDVAVEAATSTSTIEGALGNLKASAVGLGSTILTEMTPMLTGAMSTISGLVSEVTLAFDGFFADLSNGTDLATALQNNFGPLIDTIWTSVQTGLTTVINQLPTLLPMVVNGAMSLFMGFVQALPQIIPQLVSGVTGAITSLISYLPTLIPQLLQGAITLFMAIVQAVPQIVSSLLSAVGELIQSAVDNFPSFASSVLEGAKTLWDNICTAVGELLGDLQTAVGELIQGGIDRIGEFVTDAFNAGKNLVQGIIDGIGSMASSLVDGFWNTVGGAVDTVKGWLGIASPSKLFRQFGVYTMEGFALGIESEAGTATKAMTDAMADVYGAAAKYSAGVEIGSGAFGMVGRGAVEQTVNFNTPVATPSQVANTMRRYATYGLAGAR